MVYIHIKKAGNKQYYTLRISKRDKQGNVITKDIENLGDDITKINIDILEKKYKKEIRHSYRILKQFLETEHYKNLIKKAKLKASIYFTKAALEEIEAIHLHYKNAFSKLDKLTQKEIFEMFLIKFAVSSTSIEGNTINLHQAQKLLQEDILPKNKTLREVHDLQNTKKVFFTLLEKEPEITLALIENTHASLMENIDVRKWYRTHDIRILGQPFLPSPARYVQADMRLLVEWYIKQRKLVHPFALALFFHHKFEHIHPFSDGNGRTGRMIMNLLLQKEGYPPIIILATERKKYLDAMNEADKAIKKDILSTDMRYYNDLLLFCLEQYKKSYWNTFLF